MYERWRYRSGRSFSTVSGTITSRFLCARVSGSLGRSDVACTWWISRKPNLPELFDNLRISSSRMRGRSWCPGACACTTIALPWRAGWTPRGCGCYTPGCLWRTVDGFGFLPCLRCECQVIADRVAASYHGVKRIGCPNCVCIHEYCISCIQLCCEAA